MAEHNLRVNSRRYSDVLVSYTQLFKLPNLNSVKAEKIFSFVPRFVKSKTIVTAKYFKGYCLNSKQGIFEVRQRRLKRTQFSKI